MDPEGGADSVENLRQAGNGQGKMYIVPHAGHHREFLIVEEKETKAHTYN